MSADECMRCEESAYAGGLCRTHFAEDPETTPRCSCLDGCIRCDSFYDE